MRYTTLGPRGPRVSRLGFGCMRLPMGDDGRVNRALAIPLLHRALELGVTYFDTAVGYCHGDSQRVLGEAFAGKRDQIVLSTKNPAHAATDADWLVNLENSLQLLRTDHLDIYNFHGLTWDTFEKHIREPGKLRLMKQAKADGRVRHICCSFHDQPAALVKLAETGAFDAITVQYNLLFRELEPALERCRRLGIGIVVMGPVGGGRLGVASDRIRESLHGEAGSTPEAALRFVLANPAVHVALSGMSTLEQLEENAAIVADQDPFTPDQIAAMEAELARVKERAGIHCPACGYCLPCPAGVDIPENFRVYNEWKQYGLESAAKRAYAGLSRTAAACTECGACLAKCPQKLAIPALLRRVMAELDDSCRGFGASLSLAGADAAGRLKALAIARNLAMPAAPLALTLSLDGGATADPAVYETAPLAPDTSARKTLAVTAPDGLSLLRGSLRAECRGEERISPVFVPFFLIPRNTWRRHDAVLNPMSFSKPDSADAHGYSVFLRHDPEAIHARVAIRSPLAGLAAAPNLNGARLELYVDPRARSRGALNAYEEGVEQIFIWLQAPGAARAKSGRELDLSPKVVPVAGGCEVTLRLPFARLTPGADGPPREIGLDWMLVTAHADGHETGHAVYGGKSGLFQNPRLFTRAYLV